MKKIGLFILILFFVFNFVYADLTIKNSGKLEMSLDLTEESAPEEDWKVFNVGFVNDISSYTSTDGITLDDEISTWDNTLTLNVGDNLKGTGKTNFVWQIVWPQDFGIKLAGEALTSGGNTINWSTGWTAKKQQVNASSDTVEIIDDGSAVVLGLNNSSADYSAQKILTHAGESTALVSYGYIPLEIETEDISTKKRGEYTATITLTIDPEPTAAGGGV